MARITAGVLTLNEERHLSACLEGLRWVDELIVLDSGSRDRTVELARAAGATVRHRCFDNYAAQRQAFVDLASGDWILFVDADERVSTGLAAEIEAATRTDGPDAPAGYWIPRRNYIWGRWITGGGWWPDRQLRLFRRDRARYDLSRPVHELVVIDGPVSALSCSLVHYNYEAVGEFVSKQRRYAELEARRLAASGMAGRPRKLLSQPLREFWRRYAHLRGHRDGWHGLRLAALCALAEGETQFRLLRGR